MASWRVRKRLREHAFSGCAGTISPPWRWSHTSSAPVPLGEAQRFRVTHAFHPLNRCEYGATTNPPCQPGLTVTRRALCARRAACIPIRYASLTRQPRPSLSDLVEEVNARFGLTVHPRNIQRVLAEEKNTLTRTVRRHRNGPGQPCAFETTRRH